MARPESTAGADPYGCGGRWNSPGTAVVYALQSRALALLETLLGIRSTSPLAAYVLIPIRFDAWVRDAASPVLRVPSVIIAAESNYVIDPRVLAPGRRDASRVEIGEPEPVTIDPRLAGR